MGGAHIVYVLIEVPTRLCSEDILIGRLSLDSALWNPYDYEQEHTPYL